MVINFISQKEIDRNHGYCFPQEHYPIDQIDFLSGLESQQIPIVSHNLDTNTTPI